MSQPNQPLSAPERITKGPIRSRCASSPSSEAQLPSLGRVELFPSTVLSHLTQREVQLAADWYANESSFRDWLRDTDQLRRKLLRKIEAEAPLLLTDKPTQHVRRAVASYLRSPDVQLWHLHQEMMRAKGPRGAEPLQVRQAEFFILWRRHKNGEDLPWELAPHKPCTERFEMRSRPKANGRGWRTYFSFGLAHRTRQRIVKAALKAAASKQYHSQFLQAESSRNKAVAEIEKAIRQDKSLTHWAKLDLANCFNHVNLTLAHEVLPVKRKVIQFTIGMNPKEAVDRRERIHVRYEHYANKRSYIDIGSVAEARAPSYPLALPQGAATSSLVAYWLIERGLPPMDPERLFMYGDDLLILGQSEREVSAKASWFQEQLRRHPAGPLQLSCHEVGTVADGAEFLGMRMSRSNRGSLSPTDMAQMAVVELADRSRERFLSNVREKIVNGVNCGDPRLTEACTYIRRFLLSLPDQAYVPLALEVSAIAREYARHAEVTWLMAAFRTNHGRSPGARHA